ncbi:MAG: hypothetical protein CMB64_06240 [Euryarchaeota archaeon]|nr:hypothetical protein [Euryarchaeota archaeon]|tara:strand:+ start:97 stop:420 length:324 start_codon:yes stop_codon:yes gene_type:complete
MKWWPFRRVSNKQSKIDSKIHIKGTRIWLQELQEVCEKSFDKPEDAKRIIRQMQIEWKDAAKRNEIDEELIIGLDRRAFHLLNADEKEWSDLLDNLKFWRPGWKGDT